MVWTVTGWSGGSRQPLTYRLRAGQFRGMGTVRGYSNNIFINNNYQGFAGYDYGCNCNSGSSTPKWMNWMMGAGMFTSLFGNIMSMFGFGGGGAVEGQGGSKTNTDAQAEADRNCKSIKTLFGKDVEAVVFINDEYNARLKDGTILTAADSSDLIDKIKEHKAEPEETTTDNPTSTTDTPGTDTSVTATPTTTSNVPKLFNPETMSTLTTESAVLTKFEEDTKSKAVKISDVKDSGITISLLVDKGLNNGDKTVSIQLTRTILERLKTPDQTVNLGNIAGKSAFAQNIDGYIKINIGGQDYIIGKDENNKYKGFQYDNMNGDGYGTPNWGKINK